MSQVPNCEALTYTAAPGSTNLQVLVQEKWVVVVRVLADPRSQAARQVIPPGHTTSASAAVGSPLECAFQSVA